MAIFITWLLWVAATAVPTAAKAATPTTAARVFRIDRPPFINESSALYYPGNLNRRLPIATPMEKIAPHGVPLRAISSLEPGVG